MFCHIHHIFLTWFLEIIICLYSPNDIYLRRSSTQITLLLQKFKSDPSCLMPYSLRDYLCLCTNGTNASISMVSPWKSSIVVLVIYAQCFICIVISWIVKILYLSCISDLYIILIFSTIEI